MRAVSIPEYRADARLGQQDKPTAGPGQILAKVQSAGMNPMDQAIASGAYAGYAAVATDTPTATVPDSVSSEVAADLHNVATLIASGQVVPPPIRTVRLEDVPDLLNAGGDGFDGKTVVRPEQP
jgi:hypothetical protein